jgi:UDP-glucose 4-epimerase
MTRHILITGGAGFIGSHIADAFLTRGWRVTIIDNLATGSRANVPAQTTFIEADVRDANLDELRPDVVCHQAAQVDVRVSVRDPAADAETNIIASLHLLQKSLEAGVKRFVFASTGGAIYGEPLEVPQTEAHQRRPLSPYGCAKLAVEHYLEYYREVHGLQTLALRYANVYGPRQNAHGEAGVVAIFANKMLRDEEVTINGTGEQTRDYVFVRDIVAANVAAIEQELTGAYNVGTGIETSVNELHQLIANAAEVTRAPQHGPAKTGEQMRSVLDGRALRTLANLAPPVTLSEGLAETVAWFRDSERRRPGG